MRTNDFVFRQILRRSWSERWFEWGVDSVHYIQYIRIMLTCNLLNLNGKISLENTQGQLSREVAITDLDFLNPKIVAKNLSRQLWINTIKIILEDFFLLSIYIHIFFTFNTFWECFKNLHKTPERIWQLSDPFLRLDIHSETVILIGIYCS